MTREKKAPPTLLTAQKDGDSQDSEHESRRILVVDDDPALREILSRILTAENYLVLAATNGIEALQIAAENHIDLVLLDLNMPGQSGWETFQRLAADHPLLPVLIITGCSNQVFTALGAGVGGLLEKPLDFARMRQTVRHLIAEPLEARRARMVGRASEFYYNSSILRKTE
jgi:CheY-like chemotaxis protein